MKQKRIIIILSIAAVVLLTATLILRGRNDTEKLDATEVIQELPTGIVVPTTEIDSNELDIIAVTPKDGAQNVSINTAIKITFSRPFDEDEIDFSMGPDAIYSEEIKENVLIITPWKPLSEGTLYTYSVNFPDDVQKVRLYKFVTQGTPADHLPDTRDEELVTEVEEYQRVNRPDVYITNRTPFENDMFSITSDFERKVPAHYYFIVTPKSDIETVRQAVDAWLQLQGLTAEQINQLDIRYR